MNLVNLPGNWLKRKMTMILILPKMRKMMNLS